LRRIAVEEHFVTDAYFSLLPGKMSTPHVVPGGNIVNQPDHSLENIEIRLKIMDEAGIDMHVLSIGPGVEQLDAALGTKITRSVNDALAATIKKYPKRLAGLAAIAPQDPAAAADELERAVTKLGLKGAIIKSHIQGEYMDNPKYWTVFERAEKLDVPIYLHPKEPSPDLIKPYLAYPGLDGAMWGYAAEAGLHAMRLVLSGLFDKYPNLKIILGHMGEAIPYWLWRMESKGPSPERKLKRKISQYFKENFYFSTSGMFFQPALQCCYTAVGADRILFAVDYPAESSADGVKFIDSANMCDGDKEKICHINAEKLFKL